MNTNESISLVPVAAEDWTAIVDLVVDGVTSPHSKRAYRRQIEGFLQWYDGLGRPGFTKGTVNKYRAALLEAGQSAASVNLALSAIRKLATEAADNGYLDPTAAAGVDRVPGVSRRGVRTGNWLIREQAQRLIDAPDVSTLKGLRDRAILAVMVGGGLRRAEVTRLVWGDIQMREARWVIVDLIGKGNRVRTVPIPSWVKVALDAWREGLTNALGIWPDEERRVFVSINKGGAVSGEALTPQAVYNVVAQYAEEAGLQVAAHDLRRTFAKLAHKGGAALDQIQLTLGHSSIRTTEQYLGVEQNLTQAPCDVLGLGIF
jgi:site-specific recombinase XerD